MGAFTDAGKNEMLDASTITHAALFNGDPSGAGTECTATGYARQAITLPAASGGSISVTADATFTFTSATTVNYIGYYTALSGGTLLAYDDVTEEVFSAGGGTYILDTSTFTI